MRVTGFAEENSPKEECMEPVKEQNESSQNSQSQSTATSKISTGLLCNSCNMLSNIREAYIFFIFNFKLLQFFWNFYTLYTFYC